MLRVRLLGGLALEADGGPLDAAREPPRARAAGLAGAAPGRPPALRARAALLARRARAQRPRQPAHDAARAAPRARRRRRPPDRRPRARRADRTPGSTSHELAPEELLAGGEPLAGIDRDWAVAARDEHRERVATLLAQLADGAATPRGGRALGARAGTPRPAVRGGRTAADAPARRGRRPRRRAGGLRPPRGPARARALGRAVAPDAAPAGRDPRGRGAAARHRHARPAPARARAPRRPARRPRAGARARHRDPRGAPVPPRPPAAGRERPAALAVLLAGEPGIGKTRLLAEAARIAHERGATVRYGRCYEEQVAPYEPFAEALGAGGVRAASRRRRAASAGGCSTPSAAQLDGALLVLDDLHWADAGSLRLLAHLLRRPERAGRARRLPRQRDLAHAPAGRGARRPAPRRAGRARRRCAASTSAAVAALVAAAPRPGRAGRPAARARPAATRSSSRRSCATSPPRRTRPAARCRSRRASRT